MKRYVLLISLWIMPCAAGAQAVLYGKVTDAGTRQPVAYAPVRLYKAGCIIKSALSDEKGNYKLVLDSEGVFDSLKIKVSGYVTYIARNITLSKNQLLRIPVNLDNGIEDIIKSNSQEGKEEEYKNW